MQRQIATIKMDINKKLLQIQKFKEINNNKNNLNALLLIESINVGYIPKGAKTFELKKSPSKSIQVQSSKQKSNENILNYLQYVEYGKILWITFSVLILTGIMLYNKYKNKKQFI